MSNRTESKIWQLILTACACTMWQAALLLLDKCKPLSCLACGVAVAVTIYAAECGNGN